MRALVLAFFALSLVFSLPAPAEEIELPDLVGSGMVIPWKDFKGLLELIKSPQIEVEPEEEPPPAPYLVTAADYQGSLDGDAAAFDFIIKFSVLDKKNWLLVPVLPEGLAMEAVKINGGPALLVTSEGMHQVAIKGAGDYTLAGRFYVSTGDRTGPHSVTVPLVPTPMTTLGFKVSEPGLDIKAEPSNINRVIESEKDTRLAAVLPPASGVTVSWARKVEAHEAELRMNAAVESLVTLGERLCQVSSVIHYEILHRGVTGFEISLPASAEVVDVQGTGVADWKAAKGAGGQTLLVSLSFEAKGGFDLMVAYEIALPDAAGEVAVPVIATSDTSRETGHIGVAAGTNLEIEVKDVSNLAFVDVVELPPALTARSAAPVIHAFKYVSRPWSLTLRAIKHQDVGVLTCTVDALRLLSFMTPEGEVVTRALYVIRNNREQFIRVTLPREARVFSTFRDEKPIQPAMDEKGRLLVPLEKSAGSSGQARSFTIEVIYLTQGDKLDKKGRLALEAPRSDLMTNSMEWKLLLPPEYRYEVDEKDTSLRPWRTKYEPETPWSFPIPGFGAAGEKETRNESFAYDQVPSVAPAGKGWDADISQSVSNVQVDRGGQRMVQVALPVRFQLPDQGAEMGFDKSIIQENEPNQVALDYKKARKPLSMEAKILVALASALAVAIAVWLVARSVMKKRSGKEAGK